MRTTAKVPRIKKAAGHSTVPVARPIDARTSSSLKDGIAHREEKSRSLAEENDLSWLVPGALAYLKKDMVLYPPSQKGDVARLVPDTYNSEYKYRRGSAIVFSDAERKEVTHPRKGPMRIIRHVWVGSDGGKFSVALEYLQRDSPDLV